MPPSGLLVTVDRVTCTCAPPLPPKTVPTWIPTPSAVAAISESATVTLDAGLKATTEMPVAVLPDTLE